MSDRGLHRLFRMRNIPVVGAVGIVVLYMGPIIVLVLSSFKPLSTLFSTSPGSFWPLTVSGYRAVWSSLTGPLGNSAVISISVSTIATAVAFCGAYGLVRMSSRRLRRFALVLFGVLIVLQLIPQATAVTPLYTLLVQVHLVNTRLGLVLVDSGMVTPFAILLLRPHILRVPIDLEDAARIDGAGGLAVFRRIVLPLARNGLVVTWLLLFIIVWGEFVYAVTFLNDSSLFPISVIILQQIGNDQTAWNSLLAMSTITMAPVLVLLLLAQGRIREGLTVGALK